MRRGEARSDVWTWRGRNWTCVGSVERRSKTVNCVPAEPERTKYGQVDSAVTVAAMGEMGGKNRAQGRKIARGRGREREEEGGRVSLEIEYAEVPESWRGFEASS